MIKKYSAIEKAIFFPYRWDIMVILIKGETRVKELLKELNTSEGNMHSHLRGLEHAGAIKCRKDFVGRKPATYYSLTHDGIAALANLNNRLDLCKKLKKLLKR